MALPLGRRLPASRHLDSAIEPGLDRETAGLVGAADSVASDSCFERQFPSDRTLVSCPSICPTEARRCPAGRLL